MGDANVPVLVSVPLSHILTFWRPGSGDWSWFEEYTNLIGAPVTAAVRARVNAEGFGFHDHLAPVLLGSDHRVWDGHHRIILAIQQAVPSLMVEFAGDDLRHQPSPPAAPPSIADMTPGTKFTAVLAEGVLRNQFQISDGDPWFTVGEPATGMFFAASAIDPSTIRDVTPPESPNAN